MTHPFVYEINTRVWLRRFDTPQQKATLKDVPLSYWEGLADKGIDAVWLMGIWKPAPGTVEKYCFENGLIDGYKRALADWKRDDVIGSPYSIDSYEINPAIGSSEDLLQLKKELNKRHMKLFLDFVPNHFSADTSLLRSHPEIFLSARFDSYKSEWSTFYHPLDEKDLYFAHGRDPYFPAWKDTVQINYFSPQARRFMTDILLGITRLCDGVRCDMAMLVLNSVFEKTWGGVLASQGHAKPADEFWANAIKAVKGHRPDFLFLAEAYWDLEWELQQQGFDYTYDKKLTDRLEVGNTFKIRGHLRAEADYQRKSIRFIENHDERRAVAALGEDKSKAAAVMISTLQGMCLWHDGQWEGKRVQLPVQLCREPQEPVHEGMKSFYARLLKIVKERVFKEGRWQLYEPASAWSTNDSHQNIFAWEWVLGKERRLVVVNYAGATSSCRIRLELPGYPEKIEFRDLLNNETYVRSASEVRSDGLYIQLEGFRSHIFSY